MNNAHRWQSGVMRWVLVTVIACGLVLDSVHVVHAAGPDTITVDASPAGSSAFGSTVTFTAKVESASLYIICSPDIAGCPTTTYTGSVHFTFTGATTATSPDIPLIEYDDAAYGGVGNGIATYQASNLALGVTHVTVHYNGRSDGGVDPADSPSFDYTTTDAPGNTVTMTALTASANPAPTATPFTLTATVTAGGTPVTTGTVIFSEGSSTLASVDVNSSGIAAYTSTGAFTAGSHTVVAAYGGTSVYATSTDSLMFTVAGTAATSTGTASPSSVASGFGLSLVVNIPSSNTMITGVSVDLSAIGLDPNTPLANTTAGTTWHKLVTVPASAPIGGPYTLPVTLTDSGSNTFSGAPLSVTIIRVVRNISISPGSGQIIAGATQPFTLTAAYTDGTSSLVSTGVIWRVASTQVATVDATGHVKAGPAGSTLLTATYGERSAQVTLTVIAGNIAPPPQVQPAARHTDATPVSTTPANAPVPAAVTTHPSASTPGGGAIPQPAPIRH